MAMHKNGIEQGDTKTSNDNADDFLEDDSGLDDSVEDIDALGQSSNEDIAARKRLEEYLEEKRLQKELGDGFSDI